MNFLGSIDRGEWWPTVRPQHQLVLSQRPCFVATCKGECRRAYPRGTKGLCECGGRIADGTDAVVYAWYVWTKERRDDAPPFDWLWEAP